MSDVKDPKKSDKQKEISKANKNESKLIKIELPTPTPYPPPPRKEDKTVEKGDDEKGDEQSV